MTLLDASIYERCLKHQSQVSAQDFVVGNSIPIPFFGDLTAYLASKTRVVTVALNPSDKEFPNPGRKGFKGHRFDLSASNPLSLEQTLSEYFKRHPYSGWFRAFERVLNGAGFSYGGIMNARGFAAGTALHVDICSPIATTPTWSGLTADKRKLLTEEGHTIFTELMGALKPDVILSSMAWRHLAEYDPSNFGTLEGFSCVFSCPEKRTGKGTLRPKLSVKAKLLSLGGS